ncbi:MAG: DUF1826 domain-containing protein [Bacteroidota bacterium]
MVQTKIPYANAVIGQHSQILKDIHIKSKNIAIYQRSIEALNKELEQTQERTIECRAKGTTEEILLILQNYFANNINGCKVLLDDITELLTTFKNVSQATSFRLLLATVSTNMCRRFHTDINDLRLLCTYIGQGTLWVPDKVVNHRATTKGSNEDMVLDEQQIQQVNTGDVIILKGALYEDANPILHRSPSIEKDGEKRLLLRIDTNDFLNDLN